MKRIDTRGRFRDEPPRGLRVRLTGEGMSVAMGSPSAEDETLAIVRGEDLDALLEIEGANILNRNALRNNLARLRDVFANPDAEWSDIPGIAASFAKVVADQHERIRDLKAERAALLAGKWAGPWIERAHSWFRIGGTREDDGSAAQAWKIARGENAGRFVWDAWPDPYANSPPAGYSDTLAGAKAAADAALLADGWWLCETATSDNPAQAPDPSSVVEIKTEDAP